MKIGLLADIHCNVEGLTESLRQLERVDLILCAGDILTQYRVSNPVLELLRRWGVHAVVGNHDKVVLSPHGERVRTNSPMTPDNLDYLSSIPPQRRMTLNGSSLLLAHGAPWDKPEDLSCDYVYESDRRSIALMGTVDADYVVLGHTHRPMVVQHHSVTVINPGSCGEPRGLGSVLSFAILDTGLREVTIHAVDDGRELMAVRLDAPTPRARHLIAFQETSAFPSGLDI